jgi:miniconductance mechanosensitive channel
VTGLLRLLALLSGVAAVAYAGVRWVVLTVVHRAVVRTPMRWDDVFADRAVKARLAAVVPLVVFRAGLPLALLAPETATTVATVLRVLDAAIVVVILLGLGSLSQAADRIYLTLPGSTDRPIKGYLQLGVIILWLLGVVVIITRLADQPVGTLLAVAGGLSAVLLVVFRDTLLSLAASVQLASANVLRLGDWIEMPTAGANGEVIDVALHTVLVRNWDNSITTIPTYKLMTDAFKNWRGVTESGVRRIQRALDVEVSSVRHITDDEVEIWRRDPVLGQQVEARLVVYEKLNARPDAPARRITNVALFRAYAEAYLASHPAIDPDSTTMVRLLSPEPGRLPIEVTAFATTTGGGAYEAVQSELFEHLIAQLPRFDLRAGSGG